MNSPPVGQSFALDLGTALGGPAQAGGGADMRDALATCRRHRGKLALWVVVCLHVAMAYLATTPAEYVASTLMILEPVRPSASASVADGREGAVSLDAAQADSRIQVVKSERMLRFVFDTLDLARAREFAEAPPGWRESLIGRFVHRRPRTEEEVHAAAFQGFMGRVGARRIGQSYVLEVSYTALDPATATRTVNSITSAYLWDQIASVRRGSEFLQGRIADIKAEEEAALDGVRQGRIPDMRFPDSEARVISAAIMPTGKSFPQVKLVLAFAATFGLATGLGLILILNGLDRRIRTRHHVRRHLDIECLAVLPTLPGRLRRRRPPSGAVWGGADDAFQRALRATRSVLISSSLSAGHRSVGVVSWHRGEGATTVARCLAHIISAAAEPVVLVDADLHDPGLTRDLAPRGPRGLTQSLLARDPPDALATVRISGDLSFVPAVGHEAEVDPNAFAGLPEMRQYVDQFRKHASVVVDLPPLSASSDAQAVGKMLDGVVIVVEAARTTIDEAHDCIAALRAAQIDVLGVILNKASRA